MGNPTSVGHGSPETAPVRPLSSRRTRVDLAPTGVDGDNVIAVRYTATMETNKTPAKQYFYECEHLSGVTVYGWFTVLQMSFHDWCEERAWVYEDRDGEMIEHDVLLSDLTPISYV